MDGSDGLSPCCSHATKLGFLVMMHISYLPPETRTLSELRARLFIMALCPDRFCRKLPSGNFHCLILSGEPEANVYLNKKKNSID